MSTPLEGIKVVDLTQHAFGPRAAGFLAEMGADVIKIENAPGGDPARGEDRLRNIPMEGFNAYFEQSNRGKRCIAMNLRNDKARQAAYRLVQDSDVFVTNLRMGSLERLGMDYDTLSALNPRLIYAIGSGWGLRGPTAGEEDPQYGGLPLVLVRRQWIRVYHVTDAGRQDVSSSPCWGRDCIS